MNILFFDISCPKPYDDKTLENEPMGGTEATVVRVAEALSKRGHKVSIAQHCRVKPTISREAATYMGFDGLTRVGNPDVVISLRTATGIAYAESHYEDTRKIIWLHDLPNDKHLSDMLLALDTKSKLICVSKWHMMQMQNFILKHTKSLDHVDIDYIYNPVVTQKQLDIVVDPDKLVFFSSPHKGLKETLENFFALQTQHPDFRLYIANPGYYKIENDLSKYKNVFVLGALSHKEVCKHVQSAFAVYHANFVFPETFGLVHAEANALGTPVLTHPHGANLEVLRDKEQLSNAKDFVTFNAQLLKWKQARPSTKTDDRFLLDPIINQWEAALA